MLTIRSRLTNVPRLLGTKVVKATRVKANSRQWAGVTNLTVTATNRQRNPDEQFQRSGMNAVFTGNARD